MIRTLARLLALSLILGSNGELARGQESPAFSIAVDQGHPWRPPFGLDRVGTPRELAIQARDQPPPGDYRIVGFSEGRASSQAGVVFPPHPPYRVRMPLFKGCDEVVLTRSAPGAKDQPLARLKTTPPALEADAVAAADPVVNPVDLGTILVPHGWLLTGPGANVTVEAAALAWVRGHEGAHLKLFYKSAPQASMVEPFPLAAGMIHRARFMLTCPPPRGDRDALAVRLEDADSSLLWAKEIPVMRVAHPPARPRFGATYERLRYDAPISVRRSNGEFTSIPYEGAWKPETRDVVVWLPNGGRFVFWRGSSDIPFWAGRHNTAACYEWAEIISQPAGAVDCVEPLMDKELRYSRVQIVESTPARVHVRWSYQSTDLLYKVWGDLAVEDYYFYPDGLGARVVTLVADPANDYELAEFILLTPQGAYPFDVLPRAPIDALFLDGARLTYTFPDPSLKSPPSPPRPAKDQAAIYRLRLSPGEEHAAVSFAPRLKRFPKVVFGPFWDQGLMVTPCYWGSHWPLARGNSTGNAIDDRVALTPCHSSIMSWANDRPEPLFSLDSTLPDAQGRMRPMKVSRWAWLIGMTSAPDDLLLDWARSYAAAPRFEVHGATALNQQKALERRAIELKGGGRDVELVLEPAPVWMNPVVEWTDAPPGEPRIELDGQALDRSRYAWDGQVLWIQARLDRRTSLRIHVEPARP